MNAAKAKAAAEKAKVQEAEGPSILAALNPIKVFLLMCRAVTAMDAVDARYADGWSVLCVLGGLAADSRRAALSLRPMVCILAVRRVLTLSLITRQAGVVWYKEPSLLLFFGAKAGLILYILFVGRRLASPCPVARSPVPLLEDARACTARWALGGTLLTQCNVQASTTNTRATSGPSSNSRPPGGKGGGWVGELLPCPAGSGK